MTDAKETRPLTHGLEMGINDRLKLIRVLIEFVQKQSSDEMMDSLTSEDPADLLLSQIKRTAQLGAVKAIWDILHAEVDALAEEAGLVWDDGTKTWEEKLAVVIDLFGPDSGRHRSQ